MTHLTISTNGTTINNTSKNNSITSNAKERFTTTLLRPSELSNHPLLLNQLREIVNQAYSDTHFKLERDLNVKPNSIFPGLRLDTETQLIEELPEDSLIALMFDNDYTEQEQVNSDNTIVAKGGNHAQESDSSSTSDDKKLVAVASIKKWKGTVMKKYYKSLQSTSQQFPIGKQYPPQSILNNEGKSSTDPDPLNYNDWEIATCASINDKKYRGTGLVSRLTSILLNELRSQRIRNNEQDLQDNTSDSNTSLAPEHKQKDSNQSTKNLPIRLWVSALGGSYNVEYWTKRGYKIQGDGPDTAPPGVWGNAVDIQIWTLSKVVD